MCRRKTVQHLVQPFDPQQPLVFLDAGIQRRTVDGKGLAEGIAATHVLIDVALVTRTPIRPAGDLRADEDLVCGLACRRYLLLEAQVLPFRRLLWVA